MGLPCLSATWPLMGAGGLTFKMTQSRGWQVGSARFSSWTPANPPQHGAEDPKRGHSRGDSASEGRVLTHMVSMAMARTLAWPAHSPQNEERGDHRMVVRGKPSGQVAQGHRDACLQQSGECGQWHLYSFCECTIVY